ncbi:MAG: hypothetical protein ACI9U2_001786 [Bradymonadia bacterium]|jgi:membrane protein implicated in regulation of membrane protease activity
MRILLSILLFAAPAFAQPEPPAELPNRQIPPAVLAGLRALDSQFTRALAQDCAPERCFAKGCLYVDHTVVDQPPAGSLPGLGLRPGPGSVEKQIFLTNVECSFAHEKSVRARDARALATRLTAKLSRGWTKVEVTYEPLQKVSNFLRESPDPIEPPPPAPATVATLAPVPDAVAAAPVTAVDWDGKVAARELWVGLLPHFAWMIGLLLFTIAALLIIWGVRRLGRRSLDEEMLLAQLDDEVEPEAAPVVEASPEAEAQAVIDARHTAWRARLDAAPEGDPVLHALVADLLRTGEQGMLAKAVMLFPDAFPNAFPRDGAHASAKYTLAEYIKTADPAKLPADAAFFDTLDRYALASALTAHPDTELIRTLHDEFGATALVDLVTALPSRYGALLFALAPAAMQHESIGLLNQRQLHDLIGQLLQSNRMDQVQIDYLLRVLEASRDNAALPEPPRGPISDRGAEFDAAGALSILLPRLEPAARGALISATVARHNGRLPSWITTVLHAEMLTHLSTETRADLLLGVPLESLAAWLSLQPADAANRVTQEAPAALQQALLATPPPASPGSLYALASEARAALSDGLRPALRRDGLAFQALLA